jgi:hypothetical protein
MMAERVFIQTKETSYQGLDVHKVNLGMEVYPKKIVMSSMLIEFFPKKMMFVYSESTNMLFLGIWFFLAAFTLLL